MNSLFLKLILLTLAGNCQLLSILLGALMGIVFGELWFHLKVNIIERKKKKKKERWRAGKTSPKLFTPIISFYKNRGQEKHLYQAILGKEIRRIPFWTKESWYGPAFKKKLHIKLSDPVKNSDTRIDHKFIAMRQEYGQNLWNDSSFFLSSIAETEEKIELELGICEYFQHVSSCGKLEYESVLNKTKLRKKILSTPEKILDFSLRTSSLGTICLIAVKRDNTYDFVLSKRSEKTVSYGNKTAAIPCFSFAPFTLDLEREVNYNHQIIREFYEELYNKDDYIYETKHMSYDFFYKEPEVVRLRQQIEKKAVEFIPLGFGFDALNGEGNLAFLILIKDQKYWDKEKGNIQLNFESQHHRLYEKPYDDPFFESMIKEDNFYTGSVFAISESIKYLKKLSEEEPGNN